jgi:hypothetical protein
MRNITGLRSLVAAGALVLVFGTAACTEEGPAVEVNPQTTVTSPAPAPTTTVTRTEDSDEPASCPDDIGDWTTQSKQLDGNAADDEQVKSVLSSKQPSANPCLDQVVFRIATEEGRRPGSEDVPVGYSAAYDGNAIRITVNAPPLEKWEDNEKFELPADTVLESVTYTGGSATSSTYVIDVGEQRAFDVDSYRSPNTGAWLIVVKIKRG